MSRYVTNYTNRRQINLIPSSLDEMVSDDNPVSVIDIFADSLDFREMGFRYATPKATGRKPYNPADMLKLYLYGYFNGIRASRKLEIECKRNIELMWLIKELKPDYRTIADFRKDNIAVLKNVFKHFPLFCNELGLYGKEIIAIDGSKIRANNAKKRNLTKGRITKMLAHFEQSAERYLELLGHRAMTTMRLIISPAAKKSWNASLLKQPSGFTSCINSKTVSRKPGRFHS